jgi:hypothetical protein
MSRHIDEEVRPFFGEHSEPVGAVVPRSAPLEPAGSIEDKWQRRIASGLCPRVACQTELEEGFCPRCGWSLLDEQMRERLNRVEQQDDYVETLPGALFDE